MNKILASKILMVEDVVIFLTAICMLAVNTAFIIHYGAVSIIDLMLFLFITFLIALSSRYSYHKSIVMGRECPKLLFD